MANVAVLKASILSALDSLPAKSLETLAELAAFLQAKSRQQAQPKVIRLRGLWRRTPAITQDDIAQARREMWGNLGNREP
ncbi:MAG: hypothetical protein HC897_07895 [Thermoanaerobaculia bacterium]|nr:hypothetical protein [Thermoanaerobaculia bacterium]